MDTPQDEPSTPKLEGADAAKPRRGRPSKERLSPGGEGPAERATQWIRAKGKFHIASADMPGVDPNTSSRKMQPGESVEVFARPAERLIAGHLADAV